MGGLNHLVQRTLQRVHSSVTSGGGSSSSSSRNVVAAAAAAVAPAAGEEGGEDATAAAATAGVAVANKDEGSTSLIEKQQLEEEEAKYQSILHSLYYVQQNDQQVLKGMPEGYVPPPPPPQVVPGQYWTVIPKEEDVLCGRGSKVNTHPGNISFRLLLGEWKELYISPHRRKCEKAHICAYLVDKIRATTGGHFLKRDELRRVWVEIGDVQARKKVLQTLREDATELRAAKAGKKKAAANIANTNTIAMVAPTKSKSSTATTPVRMPIETAAAGGGDTGISTLYCIERIYVPPEGPSVAAAAEHAEERRLATTLGDDNRTTVPSTATNQGEVLVALEGTKEDDEEGGEKTHSVIGAATTDDYSTLLQGSVQSFPISFCAGTSANSFHVTSSCTGFSSSSNSGGGTNTNSGARQSKTSLISVGGDVVKIDGVPLLKSFSPTLPRSPTKAGSDSDNGSNTSSQSKLSNQAELPSLPMAAFHPPAPVIPPEKGVTRPLSSKPVLPQTVVTTTIQRDEPSSRRIKGTEHSSMLRRLSKTSELTSSLRTTASSILRGRPSVAEKTTRPARVVVPHFTYQYYHHGGEAHGTTTTTGNEDDYQQTAGVVTNPRKSSLLAQEEHVPLGPYPATGLLRLRNLFPRQRPPSLNEADSSTCTNLSDSILRESMESFDASNVENLLDIGHWLDENEEEAPREQQGTTDTTSKKNIIDLTGSNNTTIKSVFTTSGIFEDDHDDNDTAHEVLLATQAFEHAAGAARGGGAGPRRMLRLTQSQRDEQRATLDQLLLDQDIVLDLDDYLSNTSQLLSSLTISVECVVIDSPPPPSLPINV